MKETGRSPQVEEIRENNGNHRAASRTRRRISRQRILLGGAFRNQESIFFRRKKYFFKINKYIYIFGFRRLEKFSRLKEIKDIKRD